MSFFKVKLAFHLRETSILAVKMQKEWLLGRLEGSTLVETASAKAVHRLPYTCKRPTGRSLTAGERRGSRSTLLPVPAERRNLPATAFALHGGLRILEKAGARSNQPHGETSRESLRHFPTTLPASAC